MCFSFAFGCCSLPIRSLYSFLLILLWTTTAAAQSDIIINEVHCSGRDVATKDEFVELYNRSTQSISIAQWRLAGGIEFVFPEGTTLPPHTCLLVCEDAAYWRDTLRATNRLMVGNYSGRLKGDGEDIRLFDHQNNLIHALTYDRGFPWPLVGGSDGFSLQLLHPDLDHTNPAHWRSGSPTPALPNAPLLLVAPNAPPAILKVKHSPKQPAAHTPVVITAQISDPQGVAEAQVLIQTIDPGKYIRQSDANYEKLSFWLPLAMNDNGTNGDATPNDGVFSVTVPDTIQRHRRLVRYRVWAKDVTDKQVRVPYADDPQSNFAYFVYNGLPDYAGIPLAQLHQLPVCHLIAHSNDVDYLIGKYGGTNYKQTGTIVYNGKVYDHVGFRSRGFNNRHARRKRNLKFNLNRGHDIEIIGDDGEKYPVKREKLVLSGTWLLEKPHTHGLAESVLYRFFTLQNTPASFADYVHFRVVDHANESDTLSGDFWGIYLIMENYDRDFLRTHDLPDGNIYSYKPFKLRHEGADGPFGARNPAYVEWDTCHDNKKSLAWWQGHLDIPAFCGFVIGNQAVNNRETGYRGQHWWAEYHNPHTNHWYVFPWDLDMSWKSISGYGTIGGAIRKAAFSHLDIQIQYENQLRSFLDLLYNEEQAFQLIDEETAPIYNPQQPFSWVNADKMRWKHGYSDYNDEIRALKDFVRRRREYILQEILPPSPLPTPQLAYVGQESYPVDELSFRCQPLNAVQVRAIQWRVAEVSDASNPFYASQRKKYYEITTLWQSHEITQLDQMITLPVGTVLPGRTYRVRVRARDAQGNFSHWSPPHQFIPNPPIRIYGKGLVFHEVMYHPSDACGVEFVEIKNTGNEPIRLDNFALHGGIDFRFPTGSQINPGDYLVITDDAQRFESRYGFPPLGEFQGSLDNKGERLRLLDPFGAVVDSLRFDNRAPWDESADGKGFSLELMEDHLDNALPDSWMASNCTCGTPGNPNRAHTPPAAPHSPDSPTDSSFRFLLLASGAALFATAALIAWLHFRKKKASQPLP